MNNGRGQFLVERCDWAKDNSKLLIYHDKEWGVKETNNRKLFEKLSLEIMQAGLKWTLILDKRNEIIKAFDDFDIEKISEYSINDINRLMSNKNIIRNQKKIEAIIYNARICRSIDLKKFIWEPFNYSRLDHLLHTGDYKYIDSFISKYVLQFKRNGFKRIGNKTLYSFYQVIGVINDHELKCFYHNR
ncbi:DNA-3-methyladenine glycosylase I [Apilactobacillus micheneri]|uniref:DNA-3-methyladenine glycosylase I n=1 Tax=Apilactobacillus micheneri TaxID=1899430 RepID=A0ABY2YVK5_9LACO|nr:DNA-3-methyladenine glycosylase I [Apilactobacillus micheneri]TPR25344.1 DNA-3-methyladenine glycosylase I [Apilactobacillus micheneri]TPR27656.1 DNA-3-methyladenine glycosylase I [Apilactobacillus micheneri]TPR28921.1 DNA-3-methyladenine glycosylase I [Apilactobacillus micheneri]TPR29943.1 DNA-3-methyladenine glycosylase I [Apilactobacillus micheneri]